MNIYGKSVIIRAIEKNDLEDLKDIINSPEVENLVGGWSFPVATMQQEKWYEKVINEKDNFRWAIDTEDGFIGIATLGPIDWKNRNAFHGIKIGPKASRGKGYGKDTVMAIMKYAFEELQLERLYGSMMTTNIPSVKLYEKCGWKIEGTRRNHIFKNNEYRDQYIVGILRDEYFDLLRETKYWDK
ncbi:GNAT family N-acetyltransferase [Sutcliffiella horikoshii]|uniref:GNAT family N-acetyltransferase n=1 Tax=Sutcliffiella horikoshii TaxID=79883 RepID=A0AA94WQI8_9BACI|nr:GNAT family protein [Sutcliffiella horikoshii]TYS59861.1 GNAT family N-acetyltransferase [Sutcliffiella horikoshii]